MYPPMPGTPKQCRCLLLSASSTAWAADAMNPTGPSPGQSSPPLPCASPEWITSGADIFPDVKADDWFYEVVVSAVTYGWVNGYADGTFRPNATITRAEVTAIVNRMLGRSADKTYVNAHADKLTQFTDVSPYYWAYYDIMEAANAHNHTNNGGSETWQD